MKAIERVEIIIEHYNLNVSQFEKSIGMANQTIGTALKRKSGMKDDVLNKILNKYPEIDERWLLTGKGEMLKKNNLEAKEVDFTELSVMFVPLVSKFAYAGFLSGFGDPEYIEELPKIPFANGFEPKGNYVCFEVKGDSMDDGSHESILEGDIVLGREIWKHHWKNKLHINKWNFVIVHREMGIVVKRIIEHEPETGKIVCSSLNDYYEDFEVNYPPTP